MSSNCSDRSETTLIRLMAVARHPSTSEEMLAKLATDTDWRVRSYVAENRSTSKETLAELATDTDWYVRALCDPSIILF
jgi:hypothetical protein